MDESHFVIDLDDGKNLFPWCLPRQVPCVVSGREGITMCVLLRGGTNAQIECPMLIFRMRMQIIERDKNGLNWAKNSMILCGLDVGSCGYWKVVQLDRDLQDIVR